MPWGLGPLARFAEMGGGANGAEDHVAIDGGALGVLEYEFEGLDVMFCAAVVEAGDAGMAADDARGDIELPGDGAGADPVDEIIFDGVAIGMAADGAFARMTGGRGFAGRRVRIFVRTRLEMSGAANGFAGQGFGGW